MQIINDSALRIAALQQHFKSAGLQKQVSSLTTTCDHNMSLLTTRDWIAAAVVPLAEADMLSVSR